MAQIRTEGARRAHGPAKPAARGRSGKDKVRWDKLLAAKEKQQLRKEQPRFDIPGCRGPNLDGSFDAGNNVLKIRDSSGPQRVEITGTVQTLSHRSELDDTRLPKPAPSRRMTSVTVALKDRAEATTSSMTCRTTDDRALAIKLGSHPKTAVTVHGQFGRSVDLVPGVTQDLSVDATKTDFVGSPKNGMDLHFAVPTYARVGYRGSRGPDRVVVDTRGPIDVRTGPGPDSVNARGVRGTVVAGPGNDKVHVWGPNSDEGSMAYMGGPGADTFVRETGGRWRSVLDEDFGEGDRFEE